MGIRMLCISSTLLGILDALLPLLLLCNSEIYISTRLGGQVAQLFLLAEYSSTEVELAVE
jgi:hypothetical protein